MTHCKDGAHGCDTLLTQTKQVDEKVHAQVEFIMPR
jgi:hypothetical protein